MSYNEKNNLNRQRNNHEAGIDVRQLLKRAARMWYLFLIIPAAMLLGAWIYWQRQIPVYEVKSTVLIKDETSHEGVSASDLIAKEFGFETNKKMLADESKIMNSFSVIEKVVSDLNLNTTLAIKGRLKDFEIYEENMPVKVDSFVLFDTSKVFKASLTVLDDKRFEFKPEKGETENRLFNTPFTNSFGTFTIRRGLNPKHAAEKDFTVTCSTTEKAARDIIKSIDIVLPKKESNIVEPTIKTTVPNKAKAILTKMVDVYNETNLNDKKAVSKSTLAFINKRLGELTSDLSSVEQNVESYKNKEGITDDISTNVDYFFNKMGEYERELVKLEVQNTTFSEMESILTRQDANFELLPTNLDLKSSSLQNQIADYNRLVLERNRMAKVAAGDNPSLKNLTNEVSGIKKSIIDNLRRVKKENGLLLAETKAKNNQFSGKLGKTPRNERELTNIKRQQNIKEGIYSFLLQKQEETAISLIGAVADARIIDRPIVSDKPISKGKTIIFGIALVAGLFLSILVVIFKGLFSNVVQTERDVQTLTEMPILSKILFQKAANNWVVEAGSQSMATEMFRLLRSNIQFFLPTKIHNSTGHVLMVTSVSGDDGKRYITQNLAMSMAIADKKTVVVNLDMRNPKLGESFPHAGSQKGVSNYLTSELYPQEIIVPSGKHRDLFFIHAGMTPQNPAELMMHPKLGELLAFLRLNFDYIILKVPPVGLVSDALSLKKYVDMTLFVVRLGVTRRSDMAIIEEFNTSQKLPDPVIVLNGLKWRNNRRGFKYYQNDTKSAPTTRFRENKNLFSKLKAYFL
jgi:tyrosine-protein kinase Etk/Wzc